MTPKLEYLQAGSYLMMPVYSNAATVSGFQLHSDVGEAVHDGSPEDLEGDAVYTLPCRDKRQPSTSCSTSSPLSTPSSPSSSEPPSDTDRLPPPSINTERLAVSRGCEGPPRTSKKLKISNNTDVRDLFLDTLHLVQNKLLEEDDVITNCVRSFMQYSPGSCPKEKERHNRVKERFTEEVLQLITEKIKEIHSEAAE